MNKLRLLADENIAVPMVSALRGAGRDMAYVGEANAGISDDKVIQWAREEQRILPTEDKDFGEIVFRMKHEVPGVVLLRIPENSWQMRCERLRKVLDRHGDKLAGAFTVIQSHSAKFRSIA